MQSMPAYYTSTYPPTSPYPNNNVNTTVTTSSPGTGSTVMTIANPPLLSTAHVMTPMDQSLMKPPTNTGTVVVKRNQVKNACTNCQKACKKCDDARPCPRCVKYGISDTCVNSVRKERKKGIKRGPYKRRQKSNDESKTNTEKLEYRNTTVVDSGNTVAATTTVAPQDYGYPTNLTQYAQTYDPYHYAATATAVYNNTNKDQGQANQQASQTNVYIVTPGYPNYPVLVDGNTTNDESTENNPTYFNIQTTNANNSPVLNSGTTCFYQPSSSTTTEDVKQEKIQPVTPVPSTSNSSGTTSPSETPHDDDEDSKFARLTQLCSAALRENKEAQEKAQQKIKEEEK